MEEPFETIGNTFWEGSNLSMSFVHILREDGMEKAYKREGKKILLQQQTKGLVRSSKKGPTDISIGIEVLEEIIKVNGFKSLDEIREYLQMKRCSQD